MPLPDTQCPEELKAFWGKAWATEQKALSPTDWPNRSPDDDVEIDDDFADPPKPVDHCFAYTCYTGLHILKTVLPLHLPCDVIVERAAYKELVAMITQLCLKEQPTVSELYAAVGILPLICLNSGKTIFLVYLFLHCLSRGQPVAVQGPRDTYYIFNAEGVAMAVDTGLYDPRLRECWALVDSNAHVLQPCMSFCLSALCVVQTTPPEHRRFKEWAKQFNAVRFVMPPPGVNEIMAVMKELGAAEFTRRVPDLVRKWGPCFRIINSFATAQDSRRILEVEENLTHAATAAAKRLQSRPGLLASAARLDFDDSLSLLVFLRPKDAAMVARGHCVPTEHLQGLLDAARGSSPTQDALEVFNMLSRHSLMRNAAGWTHEMKVHRRLCIGDASLRIYNSVGEERTLCPPSVLLPSTLAGLQSVGTGGACYWCPAVAKFEGVDGAMGDEEDVYAVQAAIADDYEMPASGLARLWKNMDPDVRGRLRWNYVVVADIEETGKGCLQRFIEYLQGFTLPGGGKVTVWAADLSG
ncbi:hypothetical protein OE88DRAFT_1739554 [Heliocybe sulcata]|uniref:Uncharacterized protein n=1 Tax=Heliocybe sulcata TaxID=5364 RepID=A0A5C3MNA1_9AGAM|nr:hypothetical protein OE88DRAFT_1739554 [Heliocybe sulcata]